MPRNSRQIGMLWCLLGVVTLLEAGPLISGDRDFNRAALELYSQELIQGMEFGYDGTVLRSGLTKLGYLSNSLLFFKGGLLNYEFGLTGYMFEAKVSLTDFQRAAFYFSCHLPASKAWQGKGI